MGSICWRFYKRLDTEKDEDLRVADTQSGAVRATDLRDDRGLFFEIELTDYGSR